MGYPSQGTAAKPASVPFSPPADHTSPIPLPQGLPSREIPTGNGRAEGTICRVRAQPAENRQNPSKDMSGNAAPARGMSATVLTEFGSRSYCSPADNAGANGACFEVRADRKALLCNTVEGWLSGLRHLTRNQAYGKPYRGFKSLPFRQVPQPRVLPRSSGDTPEHEPGRKQVLHPGEIGRSRVPTPILTAPAAAQVTPCANTRTELRVSRSRSRRHRSTFSSPAWPPDSRQTRFPGPHFRPRPRQRPGNRRRR